MTTPMEILSGRSGGGILDAAAGGGRFIDKFNARKRFEGDAVRFIIMDTANLEYPDESFDTVTMAAGMHHVDDVQVVLLQMMRVLKPGGTIVLHEMYRNDQNENQMTDVLRHDWYAKSITYLGKHIIPL